MDDYWFNIVVSFVHSFVTFVVKSFVQFIPLHPLFHIFFASKEKQEYQQG